jgi:hypothetical protein
MSNLEIEPAEFAFAATGVVARPLALSIKQFKPEAAG